MIPMRIVYGRQRYTVQCIIIYLGFDRYNDNPVVSCSVNLLTRGQIDRNSHRGVG